MDGFLLLILIAGLYMLPTILAFTRGVVNAWSVTVINVFLGWTLIGWVVALALSLRDAKTVTRATGQ